MINARSERAQPSEEIGLFVEHRRIIRNRFPIGNGNYWEELRDSRVKGFLFFFFLVELLE